MFERIKKNITLLICPNSVNKKMQLSQLHVLTTQVVSWKTVQLANIGT